MSDYIPPEPPVGTWVRDRFGALSVRRIDTLGQDGWGMPGFYSGGKWAAMWEARGPLVECPPWGLDPDRCICGPDRTGENPDERPDCPTHGVRLGPPTPTVDTTEAPY